MRFMQIESVLQTINRSEPAKNRFSVALDLSVCLQNIHTTQYKINIAIISEDW